MLQNIESKIFNDEPISPEEQRFMDECSKNFGMPEPSDSDTIEIIHEEVYSGGKMSNYPMSNVSDTLGGYDTESSKGLKLNSFIEQCEEDS